MAKYNTITQIGHCKLSGRGRNVSPVYDTIALPIATATGSVLFAVVLRFSKVGGKVVRVVLPSRFIVLTAPTPHLMSSGNRYPFSSGCLTQNIKQANCNKNSKPIGSSKKQMFLLVDKDHHRSQSPKTLIVRRYSYCSDIMLLDRYILYRYIQTDGSPHERDNHRPQLSIQITFTYCLVEMHLQVPLNLLLR